MNFLIVLIITILIVKFILIKKASKVGVDQFYWLKYRKAVKSQKKLPPVLPEYLLESKQWYPPLFGWFLSILPNGILKYSNFITQLLSFFRIFIILIFTYFIDYSNYEILYFFIIIYLTAPILIYYDNQINSRIFGAILVDILVLLSFIYFEYNLIYILLPIFIFTTLLLFTHKMSHQLYIFLLIGISIFYESLTPLGIYLFSNIFAIVFFNYKNYLKHHIEIVKFWHRNRYKLGAHQFYESKLYGKKNFVYQFRLHGNGIKSFIKKVALIVGMLPFVFFVLFNFELNFFGVIVLATLLFILLTSFIDFMLCLGAGNLYNYNMVTFVGYYLIITPINYGDFINQLLLFIIFSMTVGSIYKYYKGLLNKHNKKDNDFDSAIKYLKESKLNRVIVIPFQLPDEVTFKTNKDVFWGAHGYGFKWLEPYFPVFNEKIENAISDWNLGCVFLQKSYWPEFFERVDMKLFDIVFENEKYIILAVKDWIDGNKVPNWAIDKYPDIFKR